MRPQLGFQYRAPVIVAASFAVVSFFALRGCSHERSGPVDPLTSRLHSLWIAVNIYADDYGVYPDLRSPGRMKTALYPALIQHDATFQNPGAPGLIQPNPRLSGRRVIPVRAADDKTILMFAPTGRHDRPDNAITVDGTIWLYSATEWAESQRLGRLP